MTSDEKTVAAVAAVAASTKRNVLGDEMTTTRAFDLPLYLNHERKKGENDDSAW